MTSVYQALFAVMSEVGPVGKTKRNTQQGFMFRGVDQVVDAVQPVCAKHGVMFLPKITKITRESYQSKGGASMINTIAWVDWTVVGPEGDKLPDPITMPGEAADSGDKSLSKAVSVSWREALIKTFMIVVGDEDPDAQSHERAEAPQARSSKVPQTSKQAVAKRRLWVASRKIDPTLDDEQRAQYIYGELQRMKLDRTKTDDLVKGAIALEKIADGQDQITEGAHS